MKYLIVFAFLIVHVNSQEMEDIFDQPSVKTTEKGDFVTHEILYDNVVKTTDTTQETEPKLDAETDNFIYELINIKSVVDKVDSSKTDLSAYYIEINEKIQSLIDNDNFNDIAKVFLRNQGIQEFIYRAVRKNALRRSALKLLRNLTNKNVREVRKILGSSSLGVSLLIQIIKKDKDNLNKAHVVDIFTMILPNDVQLQKHFVDSNGFEVFYHYIMEANLKIKLLLGELLKKIAIEHLDVFQRGSQDPNLKKYQDVELFQKLNKRETCEVYGMLLFDAFDGNPKDLKTLLGLAELIQRTGFLCVGVFSSNKDFSNKLSSIVQYYDEKKGEFDELDHNTIEIIQAYFMKWRVAENSIVKDEL